MNSCMLFNLLTLFMVFFLYKKPTEKYSTEYTVQSPYTEIYSFSHTQIYLLLANPLFSTDQICDMIYCLYTFVHVSLKQKNLTDEETAS